MKTVQCARLVAGLAASFLLCTNALAQTTEAVAPQKAGGQKGGGGGHAMMAAQSRYGGPAYTGKPALNVTASLVAAGGGGKSFSAAKALTAMVGKDLVNKEVAKLTKQYGAERVKNWLAVFDFAVADALKIATNAKVKLPAANLKGKQLAAALVTAGLDKDNTFYVEFMLDKALSHGIHEQVMNDIDAKFGAEVDADYHRITNQAMYDLAQALGVKQVKLAEFH